MSNKNSLAQLDESASWNNIREPDEGFMKLDDQLTPNVSSSMITAFIAKNCSQGSFDPKLIEKHFEIDFVQIGFDGGTQNTIVNGEVHDQKSTAKTSVSLMMVESQQLMNEASCSTCDDQVCGHSIALMFWMHRRSHMPIEQQAPCWGQAHCEDLSCVQSISPNVRPTQSLDATDPKKFFNEFISYHQKNRIGLDNGFFELFCPQHNQFQSITLQHVLNAIPKTVTDMYKHHILFLKQHLTHAVCETIRRETYQRYKSSQWMCLQFGRVRCSIAYILSTWTEATPSNNIKEYICGVYRIQNDPERIRQKMLKHKFLPLLTNTIDEPIETCGIILNPRYPEFCATPDGLSASYVVEVKCASSKKRFNDYLKDDTVAPKYYAQIQFQMMMTARKKAIYCCIEPDTGKWFHKNINLDVTFAHDLMDKCEDVWKNRVFPVLCKSKVDDEL